MASRNRPPRRGEVWFTAFDGAPPALGHEQAYPRPALVVSADWFNVAGDQLVIVLPITRTERPSTPQVELTPPEGGLRSRSFVLCDQINTVSFLRLQRRLGSVSETTLLQVGHNMRAILGI